MTHAEDLQTDMDKFAGRTLAKTEVEDGAQNMVMTFTDGMRIALAANKSGEPYIGSTELEPEQIGESQTISMSTTSPSTADILKGIAIVLKYEPKAMLHGEHGEIFFGCYEETYAKMTLEEQQQMEDMCWGEEFGCWHHSASA